MGAGGLCAGEHESCSQTISTALDRLWSDIFLT